MVLYMLIMFLERIQEDRTLWTEW